MVGVPTCTLPSSTSKRTESNITCEPTVSCRRSTSMVDPSTARYCLPPASTIAYFISSNLQSSLHHTSRGHSAGVRGSWGYKPLPQPICAGATAEGIIRPVSHYVNYEFGRVWTLRVWAHTSLGAFTYHCTIRESLQRLIQLY